MDNIVNYWEQFYSWSSIQPFYIQLFLALAALVTCCLLFGALAFALTKFFEKN